MKKSRNLWAVILFVLWIVFIFTRSLQPADLSDEESGRMLAFLEQFLPVELSNYIVRKAAHFIEYAVLGFFGWFAFGVQRERREHFLLATIACFAVAVCDETIQVFVDGRAGRVSDVCLDTAGALTGVLAGAVLLILHHRIRRKQIK